MFKIVVLALGFAAASAFERDLQGTLAASALNITTTCTRGTTETCSTAGYCCASVTKAGVAQANNTCVPAEFHTQTFNVSGTVWSFNCQLPATSTNLVNGLAACNSTVACANTTTQCCSTRSWTMGGAAGSRAASTSCIAKANSGIQYWANYNLTAIVGSLAGTAQVSAVCPADPVPEGDGSFGAYIKVSAMMVLALVAGMFF